jgi:hypothetical protein
VRWPGTNCRGLFVLLSLTTCLRKRQRHPRRWRSHRWGNHSSSSPGAPPQSRSGWSSSIGALVPTVVLRRGTLVCIGVSTSLAAFVRNRCSEAHTRRPRQFVGSIDGLQPEHDERRRLATYDRNLKHIQGHHIMVHCTVTGNRCDGKAISKSSSNSGRQMTQCRRCGSASIPTACVSAHFEKPITPCQFGGNPRVRELRLHCIRRACRSRSPPTPWRNSCGRDLRDLHCGSARM